MKRFKIGFLAIVAILAMSFTIASNIPSVKKATSKMVKDNYICRQGVDISAFSYCSGSTIVNISRTTPAAVPTGVCAFNITLSPDNLNCAGASNVFCCAVAGQNCTYKLNCVGPNQTGTTIATVYHKP